MVDRGHVRKEIVTVLVAKGLEQRHQPVRRTVVGKVVQTLAELEKIVAGEQIRHQIKGSSKASYEDL